jgi:hypothetical protein
MSVRRLNQGGLPRFWICLVFCLCFVTASLFSEPLIAVHEHHDCLGEGCPVCLLIQGAEHFSRQLRSALYPALFSNVLLMTFLILQRSVFRSLPVNPVRLKVKMNR